MTEKRLVGGLCALAMGVPFLLVGLFAAVQMVRLTVAGVRIRAKLVGYETDDEDEPRYPVVEFRDRGGVVRRVQLGAGVTAGKDGCVPIVYHRRNPAFARGVGFAHTWLVPLAATVVGGGLVLVGVLVLLGLAREV